jgi:hypothetical protein
MGVIQQQKKMARQQERAQRQNAVAANRASKVAKRKAGPSFGQRTMDAAAGTLQGSNRVVNDQHQAHNGQPAENHGLLKMRDGSTQRASYMGPNTHVIERLKRGDKGKTPVDKIAKQHDIDYMLANTPLDVRAADNKMIRSVANVKAARADSKWNIAQANLMKPKRAIENIIGANKLKFAQLGQAGGPEAVKLLRANSKRQGWP